MNRYYYSYNAIWLSIKKITEVGEEEVAFLQGDEAHKLADELDEMFDEQIQIALSAYDY